MSARPCGVVTLMSDIGTIDGYVAAIKGAVLTAFPGATLVDVTHHIPPHDVTEAAFQLAVVCPVFPSGTVHVVVIDPGAGSTANPIAIEAGDQYFIAPNNGVLTLVMANAIPERIVVLDRTELHRAPTPGVFQARDVYAPVAGLLASGALQFEDLGSPLERGLVARLPWAPVEDSSDRVHAPVVSVDRYGNCRTLITRQHLPGDVSRVLVRCGDVSIRGIQHSYADVAVGKTLALIGSHGGLEIAVRGGSAARSWELKRGDEVTVIRRGDANVSGLASS